MVILEEKGLTFVPLLKDILSVTKHLLLLVNSSAAGAAAHTALGHGAEGQISR